MSLPRVEDDKPRASFRPFGSSRHGGECEHGHEVWVVRRLLGPDAVHALHAGGARQLPAGVTALLSRAALHGRKHRLQYNRE